MDNIKWKYLFKIEYHKTHLQQFKEQNNITYVYSISISVK